MNYSEKSGMELIDPGEHKATVTNVYAFSSPNIYAGGEMRNRVVVEFQLKDIKDSEGNPRTYWHFMADGYNPKNNKHGGTITWNWIFGRQLTQGEAEALEPEYLIGVGAILKLGTVLKKDGSGDEKNDVRCITVKRPAPVTVESLKAQWEAAGSPGGTRPERAPDDWTALDKTPQPVGAQAAGASDDDF